LLDDGSRLRIHAGGPHEHLSELYLFAMDRPDRRLDHPHLGGAARLAGLRFAGREHARWRERIERWLGRSDAVGEVALRFEPGEHPGVAVTPTFRVAAGACSVALATGAIELAD